MMVREKGGCRATQRPVRALAWLLVPLLTAAVATQLVMAEGSRSPQLKKERKAYTGKFQLVPNSWVITQHYENRKPVFKLKFEVFEKDDKYVFEGEIIEGEGKGSIMQQWYEKSLSYKLLKIVSKDAQEVLCLEALVAFVKPLIPTIDVLETYKPSRAKTLTTYTTPTGKTIGVGVFENRDEQTEVWLSEQVPLFSVKAIDLEKKELIFDLYDFGFGNVKEDITEKEARKCKEHS